MLYRLLQELPAKWAHFCLQVSSFVHREAEVSLEGKKVLTAFSGGPDSAALLRVMHFLGPGLNMKVAAAYLDHGLRREVFQDIALVQNTCTELGMDFYLGRSNAGKLAQKRGRGLEETARRLRYRYLGGLAARIGADYILTGHHLNDLAEDLLMRLQRGAGWPGLAGMRAYVPERRILRPFLLTPKKNILDFLEAIGQDYVLDATNRDPVFLRNRIRMSMVPEFESINPDFLSSVAGIWRLGRVDADYWEHTLADADKTSRQGTLLSGKTLAGMHKAVRLRWYKKTLENLGPGQALVQNIFKLDELWKKKKTGSRVQFPGNKEGVISREGIEFGLVLSAGGQRR